MEIIAYAIPFFLACVLLVLWKKEMVWWEYLVLISGSLLLTLLFSEIFRSENSRDTEYLGGYITKITHYDDWDEWIHRTCTRQVPSGRDSKGNTIYRTETYDCSYREYHPERWMYTDDLGSEHHFYRKSEFWDAYAELGKPRSVFRDMHRHYYTKDGDAQDYFWDSTIEHLRSLTWEHSYTNKVIGSGSIMKFKKIEPTEAKKLGLYDYPEVVSQDQSPVLGIPVGPYTLKNLKYINSIYGRSKQFRLYILGWKGKSISISEEQRSYWQGGNKNELVVCLGYSGDSVTWVNAFSWCDDPKLEIAVKRYFHDNPKLDFLKFSSWLRGNLGLWKRKEFKDFDYLSIPLTTGQQIGLLVITIFFNVLISLLLIGNEHKNTEIYNTSVDLENLLKILERIEKPYRNFKIYK